MTDILKVTVILSVIANSGKAVSNYGYPRYAYKYAVNDPLTKDNKAQWEERNGNQVRGGYSLLEPDGKIRVVEYSASDLTGFNAVVKKYEPDHDPVYHHGPINSKYGFGAAPIELPKVTLKGSRLPWDSRTGSYGGWVPLDNGAHVTIISKKYVNGRLHKFIIGPIPLAGKTIVI